MKLSQLTSTDKIKLAAELDGYDWDTRLVMNTGCWMQRDGETLYCEPDRYANSRDAIMPVIAKQSVEIQTEIMRLLIKVTGNFFYWQATPSQLLDALLVATGKAEV